MRHRVTIEIGDPAWRKLMAEQSRLSEKHGRTYPLWKIIDRLLNKAFDDPDDSDDDDQEIRPSC